METHTGVLEHIRRHKSDGNGKVRQKAIGQEDLTEPAEIIRKGQSTAEEAAGGREGDGRHITAGKLDKRAAEEVTKAHTEGGQRKTCHVLIGTEGHGQQAVNQTHDKRTQQTRQHGDTDGKESIHLLCRCNRLLIEERTDNTTDTAHIHHAGDTEIQIAGLFRECFTGAAQQQRNALHHSSRDKGYEIKHAFPPSLPCGSSACS